eukprot:TRINITY_DN8425_c0_g1_i2.p1 TRINITY_DN8425_c0_g1~~TRINITY_DN8425_c0_g1_i2.p1  ORF type:complete len:212 (+),score=13.72 TRINITY_DN8425_c0_g1_i2:97-732(+)
MSPEKSVPSFENDVQSIDLIPGLPDDLALRVLAHVPLIHRLRLQCVSKGWSKEMCSEPMQRMRETLGLSQESLFTCNCPLKDVLKRNNLKDLKSRENHRQSWISRCSRYIFRPSACSLAQDIQGLEESLSLIEECERKLIREMSCYTLRTRALNDPYLALLHIKIKQHFRLYGTMYEQLEDLTEKLLVGRGCTGIVGEQMIASVGVSRDFL